ncbi:MAG: winged helix-turn-helix domain-containing protein [Kangiellaceae bacterium]|nr:winged helix-turn-helix domain-containing protein [Kangiellaceae bacterium]MCW9016544.1 winged helix-turn-helix domain-containing protein [Kangiellaceae bacterium]
MTVLVYWTKRVFSELSPFSGQHKIDVEYTRDFEAFCNSIRNQNRFHVLAVDLEYQLDSWHQIIKPFVGRCNVALIAITEKHQSLLRVAALNSGIDFVLTKPIDYLECDALVINLSKRFNRVNTSILNTASSSMSIQNHCQLWIDKSKRTVRNENGEKIELTAMEGEVLFKLATRAPATVSRQSLSECLGQDFKSYDERRLESIVSRLRKKLTNTNMKGACIKAARGKGYQLLVDVRICD